MSKYFCKDCKYGKIPLAARIINKLFFIYGTYEYTCTRLSYDNVEYDSVTGNVIKTYAKNPACYEERMDWQNRDRCGPEGRYWVPKNEKDLFKFIGK